MDARHAIDILQEQYPFLTAADLDLLMQHGRLLSVQNREAFIRSGDTQRNIFYILSGMVRGYAITPEGQEKNLFLRSEHTFTAAPDLIFTGQPTRYTFEAIQETHLLCFPFEVIEDLAAHHPHISRVYISALKENLGTMVYRVESLVLETPEQRYESLRQRFPGFFRKAFLKHIANYLGITPVSLSRIMRRKR